MVEICLKIKIDFLRNVFDFNSEIYRYCEYGCGLLLYVCLVLRDESKV